MTDTPPASQDHPNSQVPPPTEPVWTFRGYQMQPAEFNAAMAHLYRGEVQRANTWRARLDTTTNWAVITIAASLFFAFSSTEHHSSILILSTLLVTLFLWIEARRYRYYELWSHRVRLMETDFFAAMLVPPFAPSPDWAESLAESLLQPEFPITMWEAFGRRFRRNYLWIFMILGAAWLLKSYLHPTPADSWAALVDRVAFGPVPGWVVITAGLVYNGLLFLIGFATAGLKQATGEVLPKFGDFSALSELWQPKPAPSAADSSHPGSAARVLRRRRQLLTWVITAKPKVVAQRVIKEMRRGVTGLYGEGMYTQVEREVLMVAIAVTEMARLKALVRAEDPNAFVVVTQAQEVLGRGFKPLGV